MAATLKLVDYSDRELLLAMLDVSPDWVAAEALSKKLGLSGKHPKQNVATRMAWMRKWGAVEKGEEPGYWRVTDVGKALARGVLTKALQERLESLPEAQMIALTRAVSSRAWAVSFTAAKLTRREWQRGLMIQGGGK